jgi:hypothetical protein
MTAHHTPSVNFEALVVLAMFPAFKDYFFIFVSDKQVDPVNNRKTNKVKLALVVEFIFAAHNSLKIRVGFDKAKV